MKTAVIGTSGTRSQQPATRNPQQPVIAWLCGLVYVLAAVPKLGDVEGFVGSVRAYQLLPEWFVGAVAFVLPWLELLVGLALLAPSSSWRRAGAGWVAALSVVFLLVLGSVWVRGMDISCGCFGNGGGWWNSVPVAMGKNVVLLLAAKTVLTSKSH